MVAKAGLEAKLTEGGIEYLDRTVEVLIPAFLGDPVYTWLLRGFPQSEHDQALPKLFSAFFRQCALNGGIFVETADFGCCGVLMPPGKTVENPWTMISAGLFSALWDLGIGTFKRALFEYSADVEHLMKRAFTKEEQNRHWYIFIMGTAVDRFRQGHATRFLTDLQDRARRDSRPIWLEATTVVSRELYLQHGFELVGEVSLGKGKVGSDGLPQKNGEGIKIWSMFWRPEPKSEK